MTVSRSGPLAYAWYKIAAGAGSAPATELEQRFRPLYAERARDARIISSLTQEPWLKWLRSARRQLRGTPARAPDGRACPEPRLLQPDRQGARRRRACRTDRSDRGHCAGR
jgi:hypothetical protein